MRNKTKRRLELEGLRAVAALLVAVYHIWFNRVSGGVDVFFVVSGFLITTSLLSMYKRENTIHYFSYIIKLLKRLMPTAWSIGIITFILSLFVMPLFMRQQNISEFLASLFYFQNWQLGFSAVDYLAQNNQASPFQHFWALSIQFQFYIIWLILFAITFFIIRMFKRSNVRQIMTILISITIIISLSYSIYFTSINQPFAYYHTFTRVWEFGVGGILALTIHKITILQKTAWTASWLGLIGLLSCGVLFQVSDMFPGYAALWPVASAVLIVVAGQQAGKFSAAHLLSTKPLVWFGGISYAFYLWHWPLLISYYAVTGTETVSIMHGLLIIATATILSDLTIRLIENPIRLRPWSVKQTAAAISVVAISVLTFTTIYKTTSDDFNTEAVQAVSDINIMEQSNPGALIKQQEGELDPDIEYENPVIPDIENASYDRAELYDDHCMVGDGNLNVTVCEYGETEEYDQTLALVGGSHAAHWLPMLREALNGEPVKIETYVKGNCRFTTEEAEGFEDCLVWFEKVQDLLVEDKPDLIFTVGDVGRHEEEHDEVAPGFIDAWEFFEDQDINLLLVRDTPWYKELPLSCIDENQHNAAKECRVDRDEVVRTPSPLSQVEELPSNVDTIDVNEYFCDDDECHYIVGNVITHFDTNHITATYARTLAPIMRPQIMEFLE